MIPKYDLRRAALRDTFQREILYKIFFLFQQFATHKVFVYLSECEHYLRIHLSMYEQEQVLVMGP